MTPVNIAASLQKHARLRPDQPALYVPSGKQTDVDLLTYKTWTFGELAGEVRELAAGLVQCGIGRGVRTVLMVPPSPEFFQLTFALLHVGAVPVLVDPGMGVRNLGKCLAEAEPEAFVGISKAHVARLLLGWSKGSLKTLVTVGRKFGWGGRTLADVYRAGRGADADRYHETALTTAEDPAAILFTSGSTGVPKGAVYSHRTFVTQVELLRTAFGIEPGEVDLCTFPLFALFAPALGMTAIIPRMDATRPARVDWREVDGPVRRFGVTNLFGSPALLNRVSRDIVAAGLARPAAPRLPTLKRVLSAGAPVSPTVLERFRGLLGPDARIFTPYGATESLPVAVIGSDEVLSETRFQTAVGAGTCVGRPVSGIDVRIIRISDDPISAWDEALVLPPGQIGEIAVRGPMVTREYFRRPDLTALAKISDAETDGVWHRMGDVGYFDPQGRLWFCGRKSHRVVLDEETLFTDPVEGIFNEHPGVFRTALVGVRRGGRMEPVVCVECERTAPRSSAEGLLRELRERGAGFEATRRIRTFLIHKAFPVDIRHNSKIFREKLAVWAAKALGGTPS